MTADQRITYAEKIEKLAKWLDFQFDGPQIGNQVRAIGAALAERDREVARLQAAVREHHYEDSGCCVSCVDEFDNPQAWPCPTALAVGGAA